jgi:hypothetical protein
MVFIVQWQVVAGYTKAEARGTFSFTIDSTALARNGDQSQDDTVLGKLVAIVALTAVIALVSCVVLTVVRRGRRRREVIDRTASDTIDKTRTG